MQDALNKAKPFNPARRQLQVHGSDRPLSPEKVKAAGPVGARLHDCITCGYAARVIISFLLSCYTSTGEHGSIPYPFPNQYLSSVVDR
ncbi:jg8238 [Pararge aegeria aegeria]|uniref:Jg8238 protein n=1 Tax=Pararge aegeria aegeria TaxID=348720 RepID=A0A8S4RNQ5_9NEOP|nr:jg8238 [Pararge aegeria aegeria]